MTTDAPPRWLPDLPITWNGHCFLLKPSSPYAEGQPIQRTFEQVTNDVHHPRHRIQRRSPEVRRALCATLRSAYHPIQGGRGPWVPDHDCYKPFRSTIGPLLEHTLWQSHAVIAAPFIAFLPRRPIAGFIDAIVQHPEGDVGVVTLHTCRREDQLVSAARTELGGLIASLADHQVVYVNHAITVWASPGNTEVEYHHPDICLSHWVDALDLSQFTARLTSRPQVSAAADHAPADPAGIR